MATNYTIEIQDERISETKWMDIFIEEVEGVTRLSETGSSFFISGDTIFITYHRIREIEYFNETARFAYPEIESPVGKKLYIYLAE